MICQKCGKENKDTARFCSECGTALIDKPIELDLQQIKIPAASRKPKIIKVSTKKSEEAKEEERDVPAQDIDDIILPKTDEEPEPEQAADITLEEENSLPEEAPAEAGISDEDGVAETDESESGEVQVEELNLEDIAKSEEDESQKDEKIAEFAPNFDEIEDVKPLQTPSASAEVKTEEKAMSIGGWIGTFIITCIPVLGFIMLLVWAISKKTPKSKRTFAAAVLILMAAAAVLSGVAYFLIYKFS